LEIKELIDFKDNLRKVFMNIYIKSNYNWYYFLKSAEHLRNDALKQSKALNDTSLAGQIRGEIAEIILEVKIIDFIKKNRLPWFIVKSLTIPRTDKKQKKTTELDLTLFTPTHIILFEIKSRKGKYILKDECNLISSGFDYNSNVYKQNIMHLDNLRYFLGDAILTMNKEKPFKFVLFLDDICDCVDKRDFNNKQKYQLLRLNDIDKYLANELKYTSQIWDMQKIKNILIKLNNESENNFLKHMNVK